MDDELKVVSTEFVPAGEPEFTKGVCEDVLVVPGKAPAPGQPPDPTHPTYQITFRTKAGKGVVHYAHTSGGAEAVTGRMLKSLGCKSWAGEHIRQTLAAKGDIPLKIQPQQARITYEDGSVKLEPTAANVSIRISSAEAEAAAAAKGDIA